MEFLPQLWQKFPNSLDKPNNRVYSQYQLLSWSKELMSQISQRFNLNLYELLQHIYLVFSQVRRTVASHRRLNRQWRLLLRQHAQQK